MRYTIEGFQQAEVVAAGMDPSDVMILRWLVDFQASGRMRKIIGDDGRCYHWVNHQTVIDELPVLGIASVDIIGRRLKRLVDAGVLLRQNVRVDGKIRAYYSTETEVYGRLISEPTPRSVDAPLPTETTADPPVLPTQKSAEKAVLPTQKSANPSRTRYPSRTRDPSTSPPAHKTPRGAYQNVYLSDQEVEKLRERHGAATDGLIEHLSAWIEETGCAKKYAKRNHYLSIQRWVVDAVARKKQTTEPRHFVDYEEEKEKRRKARIRAFLAAEEQKEKEAVARGQKYTG